MHNNVAFLGFGELANKCLDCLVESGYQISYIFTYSNDSNYLITYAEENHIPYSLHNPKNNLKECMYSLKPLDIEYMISINYKYIIPDELFHVCRYPINIHGALLPKYRGRTPHVWSIINGEQKTGISCHIMIDRVDAGDIILQQEIPIEKDDTGYTLLKKFECYYPDILLRSLEKLENNDSLRKQNENDASYYGVRTPNMGYINFYNNAINIINFVRALANPYPGAYYYTVDGQKVIVNKLIINNNIQKRKIGIIFLQEHNYYVTCNDAVLQLLDYHFE